MHIVLSLELPAPWLEEYKDQCSVYKNKYNICERVIVKKIIPRNMINNLSCTSVNNHIPPDDILDYHPLKNNICI